jgi:hypothetical protein
LLLHSFSQNNAHAAGTVKVVVGVEVVVVVDASGMSPNLFSTVNSPSPLSCASIMASFLLNRFDSRLFSYSAAPRKMVPRKAPTPMLSLVLLTMSRLLLSEVPSVRPKIVKMLVVFVDVWQRQGDDDSKSNNIK